MIASLAAVLSFYFVLCFIFSEELRELQNYPVFLLSLIDFVVTGPGISLEILMNQFIDYHSSHYLTHDTNSFENYNAFRRFVRRYLGMSFLF